VRDAGPFIKACREAAAVAADRRIVTFGIYATIPDNQLPIHTAGLKAHLGDGVLQHQPLNRQAERYAKEARCSAC
jgi:hypothetical protein